MGQIKHALLDGGEKPPNRPKTIARYTIIPRESDVCFKP